MKQESRDNLGPKDDTRVDAYLDDQLDGDQRAAFERRLAKEPVLLESLDRQASIDRALKRIFAPPSESKVLQAIASAGSSSKPGTRRLPWAALMAIAAVLVLAVTAWWMFDHEGGSPKREPPRRSLRAEYEVQRERGFEPAWVCKTDQQFASTFWYRLGQGMLMHTSPEGVAALGLSYGRNLSRKTVLLLARVDGQPVLVFVDRLDNERSAPRQPPADLHLHRGQVGQLVLYEMSPIGEPRLIGLFYEPAMPQEWKSAPRY